MTLAAMPAPRISARDCCRWGDSGVVRAPSSVPITPVGQPARSRIDRRRYIVVVLPFVPVIPTVWRADAGSP